MSRLASSAVLVKLNIGVWAARKRNKTVEREVAAIKNADPSAMSLYDNLMVGSHDHKEIQNFAAKVRHWHAARTLPWDERGFRLCSTRMFMEYKQEHNAMRANFEGLVRDYEHRYEQYLDKAEMLRGDVFNAADYPSVAEVMSKYTWNFTVSPVPESGHLCIDLPKEELAEVIKSCDDEVERRVQDAAKENDTRLLSELTTLMEKCTDAEHFVRGKGSRFHPSFVTTQLQNCRWAKAMNINNNPKIDAACAKLEAMMEGRTPEMFKESASLRKEVQQEVAAIIKTYDW